MQTHTYFAVFACAILFANCVGDDDTPWVESIAGDSAGMADDFTQEFCDDDLVQFEAFEARFNTDHPGYTIICEGS